jgi:hypothetical protein
MNKKEEYIKRYEKLHTGAEGFLGVDGQVKAPDSGELFSGIQFMRKFMTDMKHITNEKGSIRLLDYGCGKGQHLWRPYDKYKNGLLGELGHKIREIRLYDPAVPAFSDPPQYFNYDVVTCADVMEHVPEEHVDEVLDDIMACFDFMGNERVYLLFSISGLPAMKSFLDGENLHCTTKPLAWWKERIDAAWKNNASSDRTTCEVIVYHTEKDKVNRQQWIIK